jgi:hydroxymethylpyrimidine pyrophosphatase-like HAD family hydrolase
MTDLKLVDIEHFMFPSIRYFSMHYIEYRARGTNKGRGLAMLRKSLGIPRESVLAIGDYLNDIPMAEESGIFAVPANALEEVRAVADYISPSSNDEGAVAEILEELYFNAK